MKYYVVGTFVYTRKQEAVQIALNLHTNRKKIEVWESKPGKRLDYKTQNRFGNFKAWLRTYADPVETLQKEKYKNTFISIDNRQMTYERLPAMAGSR